MTESTDKLRANALPFLGDAPIPRDRDRDVADDDSNIWLILKLFARAWPYIKPLVFGRWYLPGKGVQDEMADDVAGSGYSLGYAPFLIAFVALLGPQLGMLPASLEYPLNLLYASIAGMVLCAWPIPFTSGKTQTGAAVALMVMTLVANLIASFIIDGYMDGIYTALVTAACVAGWSLQFRRVDGRLEYRVRVNAHLVYYYTIVWAQRLLGLVMGLILADMLYQSLLQADPISPSIAAWVGHPEMARGVAEGLSQEQRLGLRLDYIKIWWSLFFLQLPLGFAIPYYRVWILQEINQELRLALVERWHQLSLRYHANHRVGDSIFRIYQDSAQVTAVIDRMMGITVSLTSYITSVALLTLLSPWLGLIVASVFIPALAFGAWAMPRMRTRSLVARAATSDVISRLQESFSSIRLIKAFGAEDRAQKRFEEDSIVSFNATYRVRVLVALVTITIFTISAAFILGSEYLMAMWAHHAAPTFANDLIALVGVTFVVWNLSAFNWGKEQLHVGSGEMRGVMRQWLSAQDIAMGLQRVFDILDIEPDVKDQPDAVPFVGLTKEIRFDHVQFSYQSDRAVLEDVSFTAEPGTITAIVGPTGSGKSTLMGLLLRLYDPTRGEITIDGQALNRYQVDSLRSGIAIALQENVLFAMSVRDNIRYVAPRADDAQVRQAVAVACMDDYVDGLPQGLDTLLGDRGGKLSTGQRQRLSIARAVVRDTPILILDEPTAALDAATEHRVMNNLAQWGKGRAIFLITHRISTIRRADNILYLDGGRIVESGDHATLMANEDGRYRAFVDAESSLSQNLGPRDG